MAKVTSKLLTLMLSFAMVFTSMVWLGAGTAYAAEGDTQLIVKLVDEDGQPVAGISLKGEFQGEAGTDFDFDDPSDDEGLAVFDYEDVDDLCWVDEDFPDDYYKIMIDGESEYSFDPVNVEFGLFGDDTIACTKVGGEDYSQAEPYVIHMTKENVEPPEPPEPPQELVDYVDMQKNDNEAWKAKGIAYADITADDFILDVRPDARWKEGHLPGATHVDVTVASQLENGYVAEDSQMADDLDAAYAAADGKRVVIICNGGQTLAARAMQYLNAAFFNGEGVDLNKVTFLNGGRTAIPDADVVIPAPDTTVPRKTGESRSKIMTVNIDMSKYDKGKEVKVWVPVPQTEEFQEISNEKFVARTAKVAEFTESEGNKMLYLEWGEDAEPSGRKAKLSFTATRVEAGHPELVSYDESEFVYPADVAEYINKTSNYVSIDGVVKDYADQITEGKTGTLEKARAIYEFIIANLERIDNGETLVNAEGESMDYEVEGCGHGNTERILTTLRDFGRAGGHCTDLNSTFVALCRAAGIPAREMFGIRLGTNATDNASGFQHCWAEFYLPGTGWVFADPGDVLKAIKPGKNKSIAEWEAARASETCKDKTEYFWGTVDNNRIVLSRGRDVTFNPPQAWGPCNTFGYPAAEVGGVRTPADFTVPGDFVYSITTKDFTQVVDYVVMQREDNAAWKEKGIAYEDITADDFILDVRPEAKWNEGHLPGSTHVDVTIADYLENGYVKTDSKLAEDLEEAYGAAGGKRVVIICNGGQTLAARAMQYLNDAFFDGNGVDLNKVTFLNGGRNAIPDEDVIAWNLEDFEIDGTTVKGLTDSGKEKLIKWSVLELPDKNADGDYITDIGDGALVSGASVGPFDVQDGDITYVPTAVVFPVKLEKIGNHAFPGVLNDETGDQVGLTAVKFPKTLTSIGMMAFRNAPLKEVVLPNSVTTLGVGTFTTVEKAKTKIEKLTLSKSLTAIPQSCFAQQAIKDVVIPEGVTDIGRMAFTGNFVETLKLPSTLKTIQDQAFMNHQLSELVIPENVTQIGKSAFRFSSTGHDENGEDVRASKLTKLTLNEGLLTIQKQAFDGNKLTQLDLPTTVTTLDKDAFKDNEVIVRLISTVEDQVNGTGAYTKVVAVGSGHKVNTKAGFTADDISDLPKEITDENAAEAALAIASARAAYEALSPEEQAALPAGTVEKLEAAEAKLDAYATTEKAAAIVDLANEIVAASDVDTKPFTASTAKAFNDALDAAKETLNNKDATTEELTKAAADLKAAKEALKKKAANTLKVTAKKTVTVKASKVKKAKQTVKAITIKSRSGKVSYKKLSGSSSKLTVSSKTGKITVKKGTKKGTYKIKVKISAAGDGNHFAKSVTKTIKVKVK